MNFDFAAILVGLSALTGIIWGLDHLFFARARAERAALPGAEAKEPLAVGTQMRFEFQLRDATPLITGDGTVVWTRENDPTRPNAAPGMGVRFDRLGDGSQPMAERKSK